MVLAVGIELTDAELRVVSGSSVTDAGATTIVPAVLHVDDDRVAVGAAALDLGGRQPAGLVRDVVSQFTADRLWFAGGRMLTPDDAMAELLSGSARQVAENHADRLAAVTVSYPPVWDATAATRLAAVMARVGLPSPEAVAGLDAATAFRQAAMRLPTAGPSVTNEPLVGLPALDPAVRAARPRPVETPTPVGSPLPVRQRTRSPLVGVVVFVGVAAAVVAAAAFAVTSRHDGSQADTTTTAAARPTTPPLATVGPEPPPTRSLTVGVVAADPAASAAVAAVASINSAGQLFDRPVFSVVQSGDDPAAVVDQLLRQGSSALVTDADGDRLRRLVTAAGATPVCTVATTTDVATSAGTLLRGTADGCTTFLALAAQSASSVEGPRIAEAARDLLGTPGIPCDTFAQCRIYVSAGQPISFRPTNEPVRLVPPS